jgi:hypothetical protein
MRKMDRKTDNAIVRVLTEFCETAKVDYEGFEWITHFSDYNNFPMSLSVVCIYGTNKQLEKADMNAVYLHINKKLLSIGIHLKDIRRHVAFDTQERCTQENNGNWDERLP